MDLVCVVCGDPFTASHGSRKYCGHACRVQAQMKRQAEKRAELNPEEVRLCLREECNKQVHGHKNKLFCSKKCRYKVQDERKVIAAEAQAILTGEKDALESRRGKIYVHLKNLFDQGDLNLEDWLSGVLTSTRIGELTGYSAAGISRTKRAFMIDLGVESARSEWERHPRHVAMLGPDHQYMARLAAEDPEAFEMELDIAVNAFVEFRDEFFEYLPGKKFLTKPVHRRWIKAILRTIYTGGRGMVLSPPRHGKSELLVHFCIWMILREPNIRILWIGPNQEIAENMLGSVRDNLEMNDPLKEAFLGPMGTWKPDGRATLWSRNRFNVGNRYAPLPKQPTMWCVGAGGRILSMDCDLIICDDVEDPDSTETPGQREKKKRWFKIKVVTRKMMHTGLQIISSRVHWDDLYAEFVDNPRWTVIVDKAHDPGICGQDIEDDHSRVPRDPDNGEPICVLFGEINPLEYLIDQLDSVGRGLFEMMYLNQPRPEGTMIFDVDIIRDRCLDYGRGLGTTPRMRDERWDLVAGLDPAARAVQAGFLWAIPQGKRQAHMIDLETEKAGGVEGAIRLFRHWHTTYGVRVWVIEDNSYQKVFFDDPRVRAIKEELGLTLIPTTTGLNKYDPEYGVSSMAAEYHEGNLILPYKDRAAQRKVDQLIKALGLFTDDLGKKRRGESDILMSHWFPYQRVIKNLWRNRRVLHLVTEDPVSYEGLGSFDDMNQAPWGSMAYPGM